MIKVVPFLGILTISQISHPPALRLCSNPCFQLPAFCTLSQQWGLALDIRERAGMCCQGTDPAADPPSAGTACWERWNAVTSSPSTAASSEPSKLQSPFSSSVQCSHFFLLIFRVTSCFFFFSVVMFVSAVLHCGCRKRLEAQTPGLSLLCLCLPGYL